MELATIAAVLALQAFSLWSIASGVEAEIRRIGAGPLVSALIVPWLTTLPETVTTVKLAVSGYPVAGLYNAIYSAVIDFFIVVPLVASRRDLWRLYPAVVAAALFAALSIGFGAYREPVVVSSPWLGGSMLIATLVLSFLAGIGSYSIRLSGQNLLNLASGMAALTFASWFYADYATLFTALIGNEAVAGVVNAYLTSVPDIIYAIVARGETGTAELAGCIIHDFLEAPGLALALGKLVVSPFDVMLTLGFTGAATVFLIVPRKMRLLYGATVFTVFTILGLWG